MSKGQNLGLAFLASAVFAAPTYGQERVVCTRDFNGAVICPQPQQQQVYVPTGPAQQPPVVVQQRPDPVVTAVVSTALAVGVAALLSRGNEHHHQGAVPAYSGGYYGGYSPAYGGGYTPHVGGCTPVWIGQRQGCKYADGHISY